MKQNKVQEKTIIKKYKWRKMSIINYFANKKVLKIINIYSNFAL